MIPYILIFLTTIILVAFSTSKKISKRIGLTVMIIAAIILSIFGGVRSYETGTDLGVYGIKYFEKAKTSHSFVKYAFSEDEQTQGIRDVGYLATNYIVSRYFKSPTSVLIVLQLLTNIPIFILIYRNKNKASPILAITLYLALYYCRTLNMLRQAVALSFITLAIDYFFSNNKKTAIILAIIAYTFHSTTLYYVLVLACMYLAFGESTIKKNRNIKRIFLLGALIVAIALPSLLGLMHSIQIINDRLFAYIKNFTNATPKLPFIDLVINTVITLPILVAFKAKNKKDETARTASLFGYIVYYAKIFIQYTDRFALYFQYPNIVLLPKAIERIKFKTPKNKALVMVLIIISLWGYWFIKHVIQGAHEVIPYRSIL